MNEKIVKRFSPQSLAARDRVARAFHVPQRPCVAVPTQTAMPGRSETHTPPITPTQHPHPQQNKLYVWVTGRERERARETHGERESERERERETHGKRESERERESQIERERENCMNCKGE